MPRGDREILKADIEDGYTKISNLILEALSISKMNGVQKGLCLFLFRRTYAWGKKEDRITLKEYAEATGSSKSYVSTQLKVLVEANVILRLDYSPGKTPLYSFNTRIAEWRKGFVNVEQLRKNITEGLYKCKTDGFNKCETLHTEQSQEPSEFTGSLKKDKELLNTSSSSSKESNLSKVATFYSQKISPGGLNSYQADVLCEWLEEGMEADLIIWAMQKALYAGRPRFDYIDGILKNLYAQGILTKAEAIREEENFRRQGVKRREANRASPRGIGSHKGRASTWTSLESIVIDGAGDEATPAG